VNESIVGCISGIGGCSGSDELDPPPPPPPQADNKNSNPKIIATNSIEKALKKTQLVF